MVSLAPALTAQNNSISFRRYSVEDGLSNSTVTCIAQDSLGFVWFGTDDGLNLFDGYTFTVYRYRRSDSTGLSSSEIRAIACDPRGTLWIATAAGLNRFERGTDRFFRAGDSRLDSTGLYHADITAIRIENEDIWIGTSGNGLMLFSPRTGATKVFRHDKSDPRSIVSDSVRALFIAHDGKVWVSYASAGLSVYDRSSNTFSNFATDVPDAPRQTQTQITGICEDRDRKLWFASNGEGLFRYDDSLHQMVHYRHDPEDPDTYGDGTALALASDSRGDLWIGNAETGLDRFNFSANSFRHIPANDQDPASPGGNRILTIAEDRNGSLWIGTWRGGVSVYHPHLRKFTHVRSLAGSPNSLAENSVTAICEDANGEVWIGTERRGLDRYDPSTDNYVHYTFLPTSKKGISSNAITAIREDHDGAIWIGTNGAGLNRFDRKDNTFAHYVSIPSDSTSIGSNAISSLFVDFEGKVWAGAFDGSLSRFNPATAVFERISLNDPAGRSPGIVQVMEEDRVGNVWIGTSMSGVYGYTKSTKRIRQYALIDSGAQRALPIGVNAIAVDNDGLVWIGTEGGGLLQYVPGKDRFETISESAPPDGNRTRGVLTDSRGILWLSTSNGILRFDPRARAWRSYGIEDGIQGNEFFAGVASRGKSGKFYFGGLNGFNVFVPDEVTGNPITPSVYITSIRIGDAQLPPTVSSAEPADIMIDVPPVTMVFEFLPLEYTAPERNLTAYKLEGFDADWTVAGNKRSARYTNLGKGEYVFRVRGSNGDGLWNEAGTSVRIIVQPDVWDQWWARAGVALLIAGIPIAFYRIRFRKIFAQDRMRNKVVRDLHDEVASTLSGIDYYSEVVRNGIRQHDESRVDKYLTLIRESVSSAQDSVADIFWSFNPEQDGWDQLLSQFRRFASGLLDRRSIRHAIEIPSELSIPPFPIDTRRKFWFLYKDMLANLVRHSPCKMVAVRIALGEDRRLNLVIAGDGNGFDAANPEHKEALDGIRSRVEDLHCSLELGNPPEGGTTWKVFFPPV